MIHCGSNPFEFIATLRGVPRRRGVPKPTPSETIERSLPPRVLSMAYESLMRCPFGAICERLSRLSMLQKGCGVGIPVDPFWNRGLACVPPSFWDHNPVNNEMSAELQETRPSDTCVEPRSAEREEIRYADWPKIGKLVHSFSRSVRYLIQYIDTK